MEDNHRIREMLPGVLRVSIEVDYNSLLGEFLYLNPLGDELDFITILYKSHQKEIDELAGTVNFLDNSDWEIDEGGRCDGWENKKRKDIYFYLKEYQKFLDEKRKNLETNNVQDQPFETPPRNLTITNANTIDFSSFIHHEKKNEIVDLLQQRYTGSKPGEIIDVFFALMSLGFISEDFKNEDTDIGQSLFTTFNVKSKSANSLKSNYGSKKGYYPHYFESQLDFIQTKKDIRALLLSYIS